MSTPSEIAQDRFRNQFNCAQSVFSAFTPRFGIPDEIALKLASPLGGGMARQGQVCGAVTGALMALGLGHGTASPEDKEAIYKVAQEFIRRFEELHHTIICWELIRCDISTPKGRKEAREKGVFGTICPILVREAVEITQSMLEA